MLRGVRSWWLIASVALVSGLALVSFPSGGSAYFMSTVVTLTASGPSPSNVTMYAGQSVLVFVNDDSVSHRVVFANGRCSLDVAPGNDSGSIQSGVNACPFPLYVGSYAYTVDGKFPGRVYVRAAPRTVTLRAWTHSIRRGARLTLHGELTFAQGGEPEPKPPFPVIVLARDNRQHAFHRIAIVRASLGDGQFIWQLRVRPGVRTTYVAEATGQRRIWKQARSSRFTVRIRR
jgi:hypothetical protein